MNILRLPPRDKKNNKKTPRLAAMGNVNGAERRLGTARALWYNAADLQALRPSLLLPSRHSQTHHTPPSHPLTFALFSSLASLTSRGPRLRAASASLARYLGQVAATPSHEGSHRRLALNAGASLLLFVVVAFFSPHVLLGHKR